MSQQNIELHRRALAALNARDVEAIIALCDPSIEFHSMMTVPGGAVYQGHDGLRRWLEDLEDGWGGGFRIEAESYFDFGEHTVARQVLRGRGRQSGADVALPTTAVMRWRNGLIVYLKAYEQVEDALRDLGVSEDALQPIAP